MTEETGGEVFAEEQAELIDAKGGFCNLKESIPVELPAGINSDRASAIIGLSTKWANGTKLRYYFYTDTAKHGEHVTLQNGQTVWRTYVGPENQRNVVREAFKTWKGLGIGLEFEEVADRNEAEIKIGFMQGDGSWSYLGTDILHQPQDARTMNFGWNLIVSPDTALHEIGHTLGLPHEHQNPNAGIVWNEEAVYAALAKPPNAWDRATTYHNIIRKLSKDSVQGSSWDPDSVMHYPFESGLIAAPPPYDQGLRPAGGLSERDKTWIKTFYPPIPTESIRQLQPAVSAPLDVPVGQQANFVFEPAATRNYAVQTFGACDTQIVLFEEIEGEWRYMAADDDSGDARNARITKRFHKGRRYAVRVRLKYVSGGETAVMVW